jgi:hypothetical protein
MATIKSKWILIVRAVTLDGIEDEVNEMLKEDPSRQVGPVQHIPGGYSADPTKEMQDEDLFWVTVTSTEFHHDDT